MKRKIILTVFALLTVFLLTGCGAKENKTDNEKNSNIGEQQNSNQKDNKKEESNYNNSVIIDDEIIDIDDMDNEPIVGETVNVDEVINSSSNKTKFTAKVCKRMLQIREFVLDIYWTGHDILPLSIADTNFRLKVDNDLRGYFVSCKEPLTACRQPGRRQAGACLGR